MMFICLLFICCRSLSLSKWRCIFSFSVRHFDKLNGLPFGDCTPKAARRKAMLPQGVGFGMKGEKTEMDVARFTPPQKKMQSTDYQLVVKTYRFFASLNHCWFK